MACLQENLLSLMPQSKALKLGDAATVFGRNLPHSGPCGGAARRLASALGTASTATAPSNYLWGLTAVNGLLVPRALNRRDPLSRDPTMLMRLEDHPGPLGARTNLPPRYSENSFHFRTQQGKAEGVGQSGFLCTLKLHPSHSPRGHWGKRSRLSPSGS